jgi:hypothetical protein
MSGSESRLNRCGPNDFFDIHANNDPDPPNEDDEVIEPYDYTGDYGLDENEEADDDEE